MAENDCIRRVVASNGFNAVHADHHEWRFLRAERRIVGTGEGSRVDWYDAFYCIFCPEIRKRLQVKGQWVSN